MLGYPILTNEGLLATPNGTAAIALLGASQVVATFVLLGGDEVPAFIAADQPRVQEARNRLVVGMTPLLHHSLALVKERPRHQRLVLAVVELALVDHHAAVERIIKQFLDAALAMPAAPGRQRDPHVNSDVSQLTERMRSFGVLLEERADDHGVDGMRVDAAGLRIVDVPQRCNLWPAAFLDLAVEPALDVLAEIVHEELGLAERHHQRELPIGVRLNAERREAKVFDLPNVEQLQDLTRINGVAREAIRCPRDDSFGLPFLDALKHFVEDGSARHLGALPLHKAFHDDEFLAGSHLFDLGELIADRTQLPCFIVRGLAGIREKPHTHD